MKVILDKFCIEGSKIYAFAQQLNLLCEIDIQTKKVDVLGSIPNENFCVSGLVGGLIYNDYKLYIIPHNAADMWIYELKMKKWTKCNLQISNDYNTCKIGYATLFDNYIVMVGCKYPGVIIYDINNGTEYDYIIFSDIDEKSDTYEGYVRKQCYIDGEIIYIPCLSENYVFKFNIVDRTWKSFKIGDDKHGFSGIVYNGKNFILPPRFGGCITIWNEDDEKVVKLDIVKKNDLIFGGFCVDNKILIPVYGEEASILLDVDNNYDKIYRTYLNVISSDNYILEQNSDGFVCVLKDDLEIFSGYFVVDLPEDIYKNANLSGMMLHETSFINTDLFLKMIQ